MRIGGDGELESAMDYLPESTYSYRRYLRCNVEKDGYIAIAIDKMKSLQLWMC